MTTAELTQYRARTISRTVEKLAAKTRPLEHRESMNWKEWTEYLLAEALDRKHETLTIENFDIDENGCINLRNP